eukprot:scaffold2059_cov190-Amphora_coffeaeformis.AAC.2
MAFHFVGIHEAIDLGDCHVDGRQGSLIHWINARGQFVELVYRRPVDIFGSISVGLRDKTFNKRIPQYPMAQGFAQGILCVVAAGYEFLFGRIASSRSHKRTKMTHVPS